MDDYKKVLKKFVSIGYSLSNIRDLDRLFQIILTEAIDLLQCDSGTVYIKKKRPEEEITEEERNDPMAAPEYQLEFRDVQNRSQRVDFQKSCMVVSKRTIPGYSTMTGEMVNIPDAYGLTGDEPYQFSKSFDEESAYRTVSILSIPMKNKDGEVIGVITLYNRKRNPERRLRTDDDFRENVVPFDEHDVEFAESIASQAAVALENSLLYKGIEEMLYGFVNASVTAVESRDPVTAGHSKRVSILTTELAKRIDRCDAGTYRETRFSPDQLKEIEFAALLHDFGKIGVRERVLVKPHKLHQEELQALLERFKYLKKNIEKEHSERKLQYLMEHGREEFAAYSKAVDEEQAARFEQLDAYVRYILSINNPLIVKSEIGGIEKLSEISRITYPDEDGTVKPLIQPFEIHHLSILKGSLTEDERREIESHVKHTFSFLTKIRWTGELSKVPDIAHAHHEKLDGSGYPRGLMEKEIPLQSKIMTVADIFDALTAADRPYKKAVPFEKALFVLELEVKDGQVDREIFQIFREAEVYKAVL
ncbi:MAG: GAF and HD-GYP domain-containing protein [Thermodesulfobacteriota bacterium]